MGQKVNPTAFRVGIMEDWKSRWYASKKEFANLLVEDKKIRDYIKKCKDKEDRPMYPAISKILIERTRDEVKVTIYTARQGIILGTNGKKTEELQNALHAMTERRINIQVIGVDNPAISAQLVAEDIGEQLIKRAGFRRTMKKAIEQAMEGGAKGIKIQLSGRLGGAEMARCEKQAAGSIPLSTLRAKVDYGFTEAKIAQGHIGIQVWINQGEYSEDDNKGQNAETSNTSNNPKRAYTR